MLRFIRSDGKSVVNTQPSVENAFFGRYIAVLCICIVFYLSSFIFRHFITCLARFNQVAVCQPLLKSYLI